jgi:hypothetical protein
VTTIVLAVSLVFTSIAAAKRHVAHRGHSHGYQLAVLLNRGLAHTPMRGTGFALVVEAKKQNINPALIAGIAGTESSYGAAACWSNRFNAFGLGSCSGSWVPAFGSWRDAYRYMAGFLRSHWPTARSPYDLHGYAACDSCWADHTAGHMRELGFGIGFSFP